ncbi:winged helix-turn-helix domain-containing protein [Paraburkholderia sediminicola]|uniref:GntR family transcriptional regulator n=1 Tax=Paraburkholderia sediminicola TaxID=458836 RepID=UPI0038BACCE3
MDHFRLDVSKKALGNWMPSISGYSGPSYLALASAIEDAIKAGLVRPGEKLPSQRLMADFLGLHVNTVNRGLRELAWRGHTRGNTRSGTVVLSCASFVKEG